VREQVKNKTQMVPLKKYISFKCWKGGFQTYCSIGKQNQFFSYLDLNNRCHSNLLLTEIMELVWHWTHLVPVHQVVQFTGRSKNTVVDWFNWCCDVTIYKFDKRSKLDNLIIRINGASTLLPRQLKEEWWRSLHPNKQTIFYEFLSDMKDAFWHKLYINIKLRWILIRQEG